MIDLDKVIEKGGVGFYVFGAVAAVLVYGTVFIVFSL